ncbi:MAG: hypothetical protein BWZ08_00993 [candidate division BRC1 bacterium ADurb.BinA292]|nr:MAG: hypothetical protein BWZ08_00993 [candidate division BRC1 bacterium ADurb.BinA292]
MTAAPHPTPDPTPAELVTATIDRLEQVIGELLAGGAGVVEVAVAFRAALRQVVERGKGDENAIR